METIIVDTYVKLKAYHLSQSNVKPLIKNLIEEIYLKKFIKQYGYVIEIRDFSFNENFVLSRINQDIFVKCKVELLCITPKIDSIYYATILCIYPAGVFVKVLNIFYTLIPIEYITRDGYNFLNGEFIHNTRTSLKKGDIVNVKLVDMKYDNKTFNCIAQLYHFDLDNNCDDNLESDDDIGRENID